MVDKNMLMRIQVGFVCEKWAFIEYCLERIIWWELDIDVWNGRSITGPMDIERRAKLASDLINKRSFEYADYEVLRQPKNT